MIDANEYQCMWVVLWDFEYVTTFQTLHYLDTEATCSCPVSRGMQVGYIMNGNDATHSLGLVVFPTWRHDNIRELVRTVSSHACRCSVVKGALANFRNNHVLQRLNKSTR